MNSPLLALTPEVTAVLLSFSLYFLNMLVPIIPAIIIYRTFPDGNISQVGGALGGWKIKAAGAWGAYVTAFLLGIWGINANTQVLIQAVGGASVWYIDSDFDLVDQSGQKIDGTVDQLEVQPPVIEPWGKRATITIYSPTLDPPDKLRVKLPGYIEEEVDLSGAKPGSRNHLKTTKTITLTRRGPIEAKSAPTPLPSGTGPPPVAANP
jgi:hypothetical protein